MKPVAVNRLVGLDDNVPTLNNTDCKPLSSIRRNRHEIHRHYSHIVPIKADFIGIANTSVHKLQQILLILLNRVAMVSSSTSRVHSRTVNKDVIGHRLVANLRTSEPVHDSFRCIVEPILDR